MNKLIASIAGAASLAALAAPSAASASVAIIGGVSSIVVNTVDPGLVLYASSTGNSAFTLNNVGDTITTSVLTIGTKERSVELDDLATSSVLANFTFTSPAGVGGSVSGNSRGTFASIACILDGGCGRVTWGGPTTFSFGNGGKFSVTLSNATFGTPGQATIMAEYRLIKNSVPEPASWAMLILGFGVVGSALRARRKSRVHLTYVGC